MCVQGAPLLRAEEFIRHDTLNRIGLALYRRNASTTAKSRLTDSVIHQARKYHEALSSNSAESAETTANMPDVMNRFEQTSRLVVPAARTSVFHVIGSPASPNSNTVSAEWRPSPHRWTHPDIPAKHIKRNLSAQFLQKLGPDLLAAKNSIDVFSKPWQCLP